MSGDPVDLADVARRADQRAARAMGRLQRQAIAECRDPSQAAAALAGALAAVLRVADDPDAEDLPEAIVMACLDGLALHARLTGSAERPATKALEQRTGAMSISQRLKQLALSDDSGPSQAAHDLVVAATEILASNTPPEQIKMLMMASVRGVLHEAGLIQPDDPLVGGLAERLKQQVSRATSHPAEAATALISAAARTLADDFEPAIVAALIQHATEQALALTQPVGRA